MSARPRPIAQELFGPAGTPTVVVIGAGIGGIAAGVKLQRAGIRYPALKEDNVELVPKAVTRVTPTGVIDVDGVEWPVDIIVMATGFQATNYLARLEITGRRGETLREHWSGEPRAYLGITVPGFPNFFMLYGPGTNGGELVSMLEAQAAFAVRAIKRMSRRGVSAVEVKPAFEALWSVWLQSKMEGTSWTMTNNYFRSSTGKVVTQWPSGNVVYRLVTKVLGSVSESTRRREGPSPDRPATTPSHRSTRQQGSTRKEAPS